jgi:hypothetical protein
MKKSDEQSDEARLTSQLKDVLSDISSYIDRASEEQKRRLLGMVEELRQTDRRQHPRTPCSIEVTVDGVYTDFIENISAGGVFIQTSAPFSVGQHITLVFPFPSSEAPSRMSGEIVWKSAVGVGVKFSSVSHELKELMESV